MMPTLTLVHLWKFRLGNKLPMASRAHAGQLSRPFDTGFWIRSSFWTPREESDPFTLVVNWTAELER